MSLENSLQHDDLKRLLKNSLLHPRDPDLDNKIMQRIELIHLQTTSERKNIRKSWIFLLLSLVFFPMSYILFFNSLDLTRFSQFGEQVKTISNFLYPAGIILFTAVILLQIDQLWRLTFKQRAY